MIDEIWKLILIAQMYIEQVVYFVLGEAAAFKVPEMINAAVFYAAGGLILLAALGVALLRNIVHSALCLTASFIGVAILYIYLSADFLGAVQILVYGGAVAIIIVMGIMLIERKEMKSSNPGRGLVAHVAALALSGLFFLSIAAAVLLSPLPTAAVPLGDSVGGLADLMLSKYVLPFEIAAVLLLVAMVGAIIIAKGERQ